jgi:prevent-host-death family protein
MRTIDAAEAGASLDKVLEEAQRQPIVITRQGQDTAVVVSIADYERLRVGNVIDFLRLRDEVAMEAAANDLTPERLADLLSRDESSGR